MPHSKESEGRERTSSTAILTCRKPAPRAYVLTDAHGRYTALLCRETARLERLAKGLRA